ncbi:MAG: hypothetical protein HFE90_08240 [Firmicutes bacterium]|nr:hypothetical protein [Bacillota bacterium]
MTKDRLQRVYHLNNEIKMWQRELDDLSNKSLTGTQNTNGISGNGKADRVGEYAARKTDIEKIIEARLLELQIARDEIMQWIDNIPDSLTRQIVYYRSCNLMKWKEVAECIGAGYTPDAVRMIYTRYINILKSK